MAVNAQRTKLGREADDSPSLERRHLLQEQAVIQGNNRAEDAANVRAHGKREHLTADQKKLELEISQPSSRHAIVLTPVAGPKTIVRRKARQRRERRTHGASKGGKGKILGER